MVNMTLKIAFFYHKSGMNQLENTFFSSQKYNIRSIEKNLRILNRETKIGFIIERKE